MTLDRFANPSLEAGATISGADATIANGFGLIVGHTAQVTTSIGDGDTNLIPELQVLGSGAADTAMLVGRFSADALAPQLVFLKSRHATVGSNTVVQTGDRLGEIVFNGADGSDFEATGARIRVEVDTTPGAGDMPARIIFLTSADAAESPTERMRINSSGTTTIRDKLHLGLAGTALGVIELDGNTSGTVTVNTAAAAGTWTFTLPPDNGDAGEQLQTNGEGVSTWEGAASYRDAKNLLGLLDPEIALQRILSAPVHRFQYKPEAQHVGGDYETEFAGIVADEAPWAMKHGGRLLSEINVAGHAFAAIQALDARLAALEGPSKPKPRR